jgi:hypothetical protein
MQTDSDMEPWQALASLPLSVAIAESSFYFPILECVHVAAISIVVGVIAVVDLRLLGLAWVARPIDELADELTASTWIAFVIALLSGGLMFITKAPEYVKNPMFQYKMALLLLAGLNMAAFHLFTYKTVAVWREHRLPIVTARLAGGASIALWIAIVFLGRWIAFV